MQRIYKTKQNTMDSLRLYHGSRLNMVVGEFEHVTAGTKKISIRVYSYKSVGISASKIKKETFSFRCHDLTTSSHQRDHSPEI